jgi:hypothetical protein
MISRAVRWHIGEFRVDAPDSLHVFAEFRRSG